MSKAKRKAAPPAEGATSKTNTPNNTACRCAKQGTFAPRFGFPPPPERGEGPLSDYLEARPGWHNAKSAAASIQITEREGRVQSALSGGKIIFGSTRMRGIKHIRHADGWEVRQCAAELRARGRALFQRADDTERTWVEMGGTL